MNDLLESDIQVGWSYTRHHANSGTTLTRHVVHVSDQHKVTYRLNVTDYEYTEPLVEFLKWVNTSDSKVVPHKTD